MPRAEIPVGYAKATAKGTYGPTTWQNVMYFLVTPADGETQLETAQDVCWGMSELYNKLGYAHFSNNWNLHLTRVQWRDATDDVVKSSRLIDESGTDSSGDQDAQVCYLLNWDTGDIRRGGKPRSYISGVPIDACADSATLDTGFLGDMGDGLLDWFTELAAGGAPSGAQLMPVEMSFIDGGVDRTTPQPFLFTSGTVNAVVATQRRRVDRLRG